MPIICPTITTNTTSEYNKQLKRVTGFAERIHIDLADGVFTPNTLISLDSIWWPVGITADIHLMYEAVLPFIDKLINLKPHMVIVHAEAVGNFYTIAHSLKKHGIKTGVALLQDTPITRIVPAIDDIDHILIFSGDLGYFGGHAKLSLLQKIAEIRRIKRSIEIGWDGGINSNNAYKLALGGVDVLNVGGAIQLAKNPAETYGTLKALANKKNENIIT